MNGAEYTEGATVALAMFLDDAGFSYVDGISFAEQLAERLVDIAADRSHAPGYEEATDDD